MSHITLATPWSELPLGWKWAFRIGGGLFLCLPLLAFAHLQAHSPFAPSWQDWFTLVDVLRLLGRGLPWAGAVALVAIAGRRRPLCLWILASVAVAGISCLLFQTGRFQPELWRGSRVPLLSRVETSAGLEVIFDGLAIIRDSSELEKWRGAVAASDEADASESEAPQEAKRPFLDIDLHAEMGIVVDQRRIVLDRVEVRKSGGALHVLVVRKARWVPSGISHCGVYERVPVILAAMERTTLPIQLEEVCVRGFRDDFPEWLARFLCFWEWPIPLGAESLR